MTNMDIYVKKRNFQKITKGYCILKKNGQTENIPEIWQTGGMHVKKQYFLYMNNWNRQEINPAFPKIINQNGESKCSYGNSTRRRSH